jgi:hypothetical protein
MSSGHCLEFVIATIDDFEGFMVVDGLSSYIVYENLPFDLSQLLATVHIFHFWNALSSLTF